MMSAKKQKISIFLPPDIARSMKARAIRWGCRGVSEYIETIYMMCVVLTEKCDKHPEYKGRGAPPTDCVICGVMRHEAVVEKMMSGAPQ